MEMFSSLRGDKNELCLVVIKFKHFIIMRYKNLYVISHYDLLVV